MRDELFPGKLQQHAGVSSKALVAPDVRAARKLSSGWCSALWLGNGEELAPSFPSRCYPEAGKQSRSFSLLRHSNAKEGRRWRSPVLAWSTADGAGKPIAQDLFDAASLLLPGEAGSGEVGAALMPAQPQEAASECERWHPATLHPHLALASFPPKCGWKRSCLPLGVSSAVAPGSACTC